MGADKQRLDKWLWYARVVKSRTLAAKLVAAGEIRVDRERVDNPAHGIRVGQVLTFMVHGRLCVWRVTDLGERRGPASEARGLYEEVG